MDREENDSKNIFKNEKNTKHLNKHVLSAKTFILQALFDIVDLEN